MKNFTPFNLLVLFFISVFPSNTKAQISLTASDFESMLEKGTNIVSHYDTVSMQIDVGFTGQNSWDFSELIASIEYVSESKEKSETPYTDEFPDAEYASFYEGNFDSIFTSSWSYTSITDNLVTHGAVTLANSEGGDVESVIKYDPLWIEYYFPVNYQDENTYEGTQTIKTIVNVPGTGKVSNTTEQEVVIVQRVDGYGVMTLPGGRQVNALRVVEVTTFTNGGIETVSTTIKFVSKTGEMVSIEPVDDSETTGVITISSASWTDGVGEGSVVEKPNAPSDFDVMAGTESVDLMWTDNSDNETGFYIERSDDGGDFMVIDSTDADIEMYTDTSVVSNVEYAYRVVAFNSETMSGYSTTVRVTITTTNVFSFSDSENGFSLGPNYPNPVSSNAIISFEIPKNDRVVVSLLNAEGKLIKTLLNREMGKGKHNIHISAQGLENGIYFYQMKTGNFVESKSLLVAK